MAAKKKSTVLPPAENKILHNGIIIQQAEGDLHRAMLALAEPRLVVYAHRHRFAVMQETVNEPLNAALGFRRWQSILKAFNDGYDYAVFLETDTIIADLSVDFRTAVEEKPLALVYGQVPGGEPPHYNTGVIIARNTPDVIRFQRAVVAETPDPDMPEELGVWWKRPHCQQVVFNRLAAEHPELITPLPTQWNDVYQREDAIIVAWHGVEDERLKLDRMAKWLIP
jgi:hypothetical protein